MSRERHHHVDQCLCHSNLSHTCMDRRYVSSSPFASMMIIKCAPKIISHTTSEKISDSHLSQSETCVVVFLIDKFRWSSMTDHFYSLLNEEEIIGFLISSTCSYHQHNLSRRNYKSSRIKIRDNEHDIANKPWRKVRREVLCYLFRFFFVDFRLILCSWKSFNGLHSPMQTGNLFLLVRQPSTEYREWKWRTDHEQEVLY